MNERKWSNVAELIQGRFNIEGGPEEFVEAVSSNDRLSRNGNSVLNREQYNRCDSKHRPSVTMLNNGFSAMTKVTLRSRQLLIRYIIHSLCKIKTIFLLKIIQVGRFSQIRNLEFNQYLLHLIF